jgi:hypothetical protein
MKTGYISFNCTPKSFPCWGNVLEWELIFISSDRLGLTRFDPAENYRKCLQFKFEYYKVSKLHIFVALRGQFLTFTTL